MSDNAAAVDTGNVEAIGRGDLPAMFLAELQAESAPPAKAKAKAAPAAPDEAAPANDAIEAEAAPDEAAPADTESEAEEADDTATAEASDEAETPTDAEPIAAPSGMNDADKAIYAKLPSELKAWVAKQESARTADYTRKTQVVAEHKKQFEQGVNQVTQRLAALDGYLAKFTDNVPAPPDPALRHTDPMAYDEQLANHMHAKHVAEVAAKERTRVEAEQKSINDAQMQTYYAEQAEALKQNAPELLAENGAKLRQVESYGLKAGYSPEQLRMASANDILTLWKAQRFDAIEAAKKSVKPVPQSAPKAMKPGPAKAVGRPSQVASALKTLDAKPSRENLANAYLAEIRSEKR